MRRAVGNLRAYQGDSHQQAELTANTFDLILGCNLIDRLHTPSAWLQACKVIFSPKQPRFSW